MYYKYYIGKKLINYLYKIWVEDFFLVICFFGRNFVDGVCFGVSKVIGNEC